MKANLSKSPVSTKRKPHRLFETPSFKPARKRTSAKAEPDKAAAPAMELVPATQNRKPLPPSPYRT